MLVCCHSPHWPTSDTHCTSGLILLAGLPLVGIPCLPSFSSLTYLLYGLLVWLILLTDLHLVGIRHLPSFSLLDNISYMLPVWPHSHCWPLLLRVASLTSLPQTYVRTCARNAVLGITGLLLVRVARLASFLADLYHVRVACLLLFTSLAYISYALLVWPHSPH